MIEDCLQTDVLVIGSGLGGLAAAWEAAKRGCQVTLLTRARNPAESNTDRAQGGIIYHAPGESPEQLVADILSVGGGVSPGMPRENILAMLEALQEFNEKRAGAVLSSGR